MTRYAVYGIPGVDERAPEQAVALRRRVEEWYAAHHELTVQPRRYGFHATLKAPFRLGDGVLEHDLDAAVARIAASRPAVLLRDVRPAAIDGFRALVPAGGTTEVDRLAAAVVTELDPLRAPLSPQERSRRCPDRLSDRQRELLDRFGYPYVLDEFRVHMTLTDPLDEDAVDEAIAAHFAGLTGGDVPLTSLAVCVEPGHGDPFEVHSVHPLAAGELLTLSAAHTEEEHR